MSAITAKASRKMKKYAVLTREPRCFLGSFDFSWEQRKLGDMMNVTSVKRIHQSDWTDSGVRFLRARDIVAAAKNEEPDDYLYISKEKYEEYSTLSGKVGVSDLLVTGVGTIGVPYLVRNLEPLYFKDGNIIWFQNSDKIDGKFLFYSFSAEQIQGFINESAGIGTVGTYTIESGKKTPISLPNQIEQAKVGEFFQQLDNLITLHQRKCALLFSPFQAFISMMFITSTFSWEQRKFEEIAVRSSVICSDDTLPRVEYEDIVSGTGRLNKDIYAKQSSKSGIVFHQGDVLYGKLRPYLQNWLLPTFDGLAVGDFWVLQPQNADSSFLYRLIQSRQFDEVANQSTGTKMPRADWKLVSKTVFSIPSNISEQAAIGTYFTALDSLITLHQRKCIFFTGRAGRLISTVNKKRITSSWEQREVGDLLIERSQQAPMSDEYPLMAFIANEGVAPKGERYDRSALVTDTVNKLYKKTEKGDFIYSSNNLETGSIGLNKYGKACISPVYSIFEPTGIADSDFLGRRLVRKDFINAMVKWRQGVIYGQWRIHESDFLKIEISVPSVEEQRKIGAYLDQLDNLITLHQRKPFLMKWRTSDANRNQTNRLVL